jgi:ribosomal protein S6
LPEPPVLEAWFGKRKNFPCEQLYIIFMHTQGYELLYIVSSTKNDEEVKNVMSAVGEILAKFSAVILHHGPWNKRALEYKIRGVEHGTYILAYFTVE